MTGFERRSQYDLRTVESCVQNKRVRKDGNVQVKGKGIEKEDVDGPITKDRGILSRVHGVVGVMKSFRTRLEP